MKKVTVMQQCNMKVRQAVKKAKMPLWVLADLLDISEPTLFRWLRHELPEEKQENMLRLVEEWLDSQ